MTLKLTLLALLVGLLVALVVDRRLHQARARRELQLLADAARRFDGDAP